MKIKHVLMTFALAAATLTAAGQTVTTNAGTSYTPAQLAVGTLQNATTLTISGTWTAYEMQKLRKAITGVGTYKGGSNAVLQTVTFSSTAVMEGMDYLFYDCTALKSVKMPTKTNNKAVSFEYAFQGCTALAGTVNLSGFTNISDMYEAFYNCAALQGVKMPTATNATAVSFERAFSGCTALAGTVNLSGFTKISDMYYAFYGCAALQGVTMPTGTNSADVRFNSAFYGCAALAGTVDLSGFTKISTMQNAFFSCAVLGSVTMPTETNTAAVSFSGAFYGCEALESIDLRAFTAISNMASAFSGCTRLTLEGLQLPATNTPPATGVSFYSTFKGCTALAGSIDLSVFTKIKSMESAFNGCTGVTGVTLPAVENATAVTFKSAFTGCTALKTADLSKFTAISNMRDTFNGCTALTAVTMPTATNTAAVTFWNAFYGCTVLAGTVDLSGFTNISNMQGAFYGCNALTAVKLGGALPATTTGAFSNANLNCLVYVPAEWGTKPSSWYNIVYIPGGTTEGNSTLWDNNPFHCPEAFTLGASNTMSYKRTLTQNQWATVCLPFTAPVPTDCIAKELSSSTGETVTFAQVQTLEANKPYIVAYTGGTATQSITFASEWGATIPATPEAMETEPANASYKMAGTYADIQDRSMYLLGDNSFLLYNHGNLHPFRAYITATGGAPNQAPRLAIGNEGGATGIGCIESPEAEAIPAISHVYTLDGRLVKTVPAEEYGTLKEGLARGVYIVNGQKVTVTE